MAYQFTDKELRERKEIEKLNTVKKIVAFYRENPHRFAEDYLGIELRDFQKILIYEMEHNDYFYYVASRGQGKTFLVALYACIRCILYPGTKVVTVSYTFKQGMEIINKITQEFMYKSSTLNKEIDHIAKNNSSAMVTFKNGSYIEVRVAGEGARGARGNLLIVDEARMISQETLNRILRPIKANEREPRFMSLPEYRNRKDLREHNKEIYMSSAWYKQSEMYEQVKTYFANSLDDRYRYFVCALPYQLSIKEDLLPASQIEAQMSEETFSDIAFMMEYEAKFYGASEDSLFSYENLTARRTLVNGLHPLSYYRETLTPIQAKEKGETRILSLDVALLASRRHNNDASCFIINQCIMKSTNPVSNISFVDTQEGLLTEELGLIAMRYFYQYDCDWFVVDANGVGQGVLDYVMNDRYDNIYGCTYKAINVVNNDDLASRCKNREAAKCVFAIKANAKQNSDMCLSLRAGLQNGYINFLINETEMEDKWPTCFKGYSKFSDSLKRDLKLPYYQTTAMIDEMVNLEHDVVGGNIKVKERTGMRKDRYSSLEYNYYVVQELTRKRRVKTVDNTKFINMLPMKRGAIPGLPTRNRRWKEA